MASLAVSCRTELVMTLLAPLCRTSLAASIVFPGEEGQDVAAANRTLPQLVFTEEPECVKESEFGVCESAGGAYPTDLVERALASDNEIAVVELSRGDNVLLELGSRFGSSTVEDKRLVEETAACTASESIIYPKMAKNQNNEWLFVVNSGEVTQGIRVEKCVDEGRPCMLGVEGTVCRQKYIYRKLLAVNASGKMTTDNFRIPSCCVCYIKNDFLRVRFGAKKPSSSSSSLAAAAARAAAGMPSTMTSPTKRRPARQVEPEPRPELELVGDETSGLSGSPLDGSLPVHRTPQQGTAQQSIETENTLNPSDTIGGLPVGRFAGEIVVHSNPIVVQKRPKQ